MPFTTTWDAKQVADYFIWKGQQEGKPVTNKKLQKLLYYAQAWTLALQDKKLFSQNIEAWVHGPAIPDVYLEYKNFGFQPIKKEINPEEFRFSKEQKEIMDQVWSVYGKYDAKYLELLTHSEKPWQNARLGVEPDVGSTNKISPESMKEFYRAKLEANK